MTSNAKQGSLSAPGSSAAIDYDLMRRQLARSVSRICPFWLAEHKEDIIQAALLRVLETPKRPEHNGVVPSSYLWRVAYTATIDEIRRVRRTQHEPLDEETTSEAAAPSSSNPYRDQTSKDLGSAIRACLGGLNDARRRVVGLFLLGHDLSETEGLTGLDGKSVRNLLYRGLGNLRQCLSAKGLRP